MKKMLTLVLLSLSFSLSAQIADLPENICPLLIGEKIPNTILHNDQGKAVETDDILAKKTVLVVYRGGWCPYCNSQLSDLQDIENQILQLGYQIIAVSPDAPSFIKQTEGKKALAYQFFSDSEGVFSQALGIAYKKEKAKLDKFSEGKNPGFLPVPSVYVLNEKREIEFLYINPNYAKRLEGNLLLAVLKAL